MSEPLLRARDLGRVHASPAGEVHACVGVDLEVRPGELVVVRGRSGAGKTSLLSLLGGLDTPTTGTVELAGHRLDELDDDAVARLRQETVGYVFSALGLLPVLSAAENVEVPLRVLRTAPDVRRARVAELLEALGLDPHAAQRPHELSGGQQQRVGLARALAPRPRLLLADEPTGQLDSDNALRVVELLSGLVQHEGLAAVVTTHFAPFEERADRVLRMRDGRLEQVGS